MTDEQLFDEFIKITNFSFPIKKRPYRKELINWIEKYNSSIKNSFIISDVTKTKIVNFGEKLIQSYDLHKTSYEQSFKCFCELMDENNEIFPFAYLGQREIYMCLNESYYRISTMELDYENMLHKPYPPTSSPTRFCSKKYAISYMSTSPLVCWYELGKPEMFYCAKYNVINYDKRTQKLLRLDINPVSAHNEIRRLICNHEDVLPYIKKYLFIFPLIAACSFVEQSREKDEYIIPSLLMEWIGESSDYLGIRYYSDSLYKAAHKKWDHNIALIGRNPNLNGISNDLISIFEVKKDGIVKPKTLYF